MERCDNGVHSVCFDETVVAVAPVAAAPAVVGATAVAVVVVAGTPN